MSDPDQLPDQDGGDDTTDDAGDDATDDAGDAGDSSAEGGAAEGATDGPRKRRRRRRRRKKNRDEAATTDPTAATSATATDAPAAAAPVTQPPRREPPPSEPRRNESRPRAPQHESRQEPRAPRPPSREAAAFASLTAGLFSHLDDRPVPCKVDGCNRTWMWTAAEQIESFGQPPPRRMCAEHLAASTSAADAQIRCTNPWCERTWTWTRSAQLAASQRGGPRKPDGTPLPPSRVCDHCIREEKELPDAQVPCRVDGCSGTWTWTRDAQLKHRAWLRHQPAQPAAGKGGETSHEGRGRRRRRGRGQSTDGPPPRMCESCRQRLAALVDRETLCKVHGCTRQVKIDRESQLRAWVAAGDRDLADVPLPKRMCEVCREFCRLHRDREVACARPGCANTWTYKSGAQLQAFLAGHFEDPARLCAECVASGHAQHHNAVLPGVENMPCVVPLCDGIWHYVVGMSIAPSNDGDQPIDRMCNDCRTQRGASARPVPQVEGQNDVQIDEAHANGDSTDDLEDDARHEGDLDDESSDATEGTSTAIDPGGASSPTSDVDPEVGPEISPSA